MEDETQHSPGRLHAEPDGMTHCALGTGHSGDGVEDEEEGFET